MAKMTLNVEKREKGKALSPESIPAVFYGRKEESTPIAILEKEFSRLYKEAGESTIISLHGIGKDIDAIVQDVQFHPVTDKPLHVDFYTIEKDRKITVDVPLEFVGESPAEKDGFVIVKVMHEIEIESLPANLPPQIEVDMTKVVDLESQILVKNLPLPDGVEATAEPEEVVISVSEAREEEEETPPTEVDMDSIEVEGGKRDGDTGVEQGSESTKESDTKEKSE